MKNNKLNLIAALLYLLASICFIITAITYDQALSKGLSIVASIFLFISSIGFFCTYVKNKRTE